MWFITAWLCIEGTTGSAWAQFDNELPVACFTSVTPPAPKIGEQVTISGTCSYDPDGVVFQYQWTFSDGQAAYTGSESSITRTFSQAGTYVVFLQVKDNDGAWSGKIRQNITVTASNFTVNIIPSADCTVTAGDGGVDAPEAPNGIVCSGGMAATNPLCTEQFKNADIAALKVVPEAGYAFAYWDMNGGIVQHASAEPLFLSTMPLFASIVVVPTSRVATLNAHCLSATLQSVTFDGTPAAAFVKVVKDDGSPYPETHWDAARASTPSPVAFVAGSRMTATVTLAVQPADFSGTLLIEGTGSGANGFDFPPTVASVKNGVASVTIPCRTPFPEKTIDMFDPMTIIWSYQTASGRFHEAGTSANPVYVTWAPPSVSSVYHTLVHVGCKAAKGVTGTPGVHDDLVLKAIWDKAFDRDTKTQPIRRVSDGKLLSYYGFFDTNGSTVWDAGDENRNATEVQTVANLLKTGNGQCYPWAYLLYDVMNAQGLKSINGKAIQRIDLEIKSESDFFAVKEWNTSGNSPWRVGNIDAGVDGSQATTPAVGEACDALGVSGQGTSPNPPSRFTNHYIVYMDGHLYDPSYGLGPFSFWGKKAYEDAAFAERLYYDPQDPFTLRLAPLPPDNGDSLDDTDLINEYSVPLPF